MLLDSNGINEDNVITVEPGTFAITNKKQTVLATDNTFSCTNFLAYTDKFAYLLHMLPSEAIGRNQKFIDHLGQLKICLKQHYKNFSTLNVRIICGVVENSENDYKVHNLKYINEQLKQLEDYCLENGIEFNRLEDEISRYVIFDYQNDYLIIEEKKTKYF